MGERHPVGRELLEVGRRNVLATVQAGIDLRVVIRQIHYHVRLTLRELLRKKASQNPNQHQMQFHRRDQFKSLYVADRSHQRTTRDPVRLGIEEPQ